MNIYACAKSVTCESSGLSAEKINQVFHSIRESRTECKQVSVCAPPIGDGELIVLKYWVALLLCASKTVIYP